METQNAHAAESAPPGTPAAHGSHAPVFIVLAVLTGVMVAVSGMDLGLGPNGPAMVIGGLALLQAIIVVLFGMHLKSEPAIIFAVALFPLLLVAVLIALNLQDAGALAVR